MSQPPIITIISGVIFRILVAAFGGWLASRGYDEARAAELLGGLALLLAMAAWGFWTRLKLRGGRGDG